MSKKRKPTTDAVEIVDRRYFEGKPDMLAALDEAKANDEDGEAEYILEQHWTGLCYTAALCWVREADDEGWMVVHGTVLSEKVGKRIEHAWCERGDWIIDLAMPVGARFIERERYYRVVKPEDTKVYSAEEAVVLSLKHRHDGPWD